MRDNIKAFLGQHIRSVWHLEVLLALRTAGAPCTSEQLARSLYMAPDSVSHALQKFEVSRLVEQDTRQMYSLSPNSKNNETINELAALYSANKASIIDCIYSRPTQQFPASNPHLGY